MIISVVDYIMESVMGSVMIAEEVEPSGGSYIIDESGNYIVDESGNKILAE